MPWQRSFFKFVFYPQLSDRQDFFSNFQNNFLFSIYESFSKKFRGCSYFTCTQMRIVEPSAVLKITNHFKYKLDLIMNSNLKAFLHSKTLIINLIFKVKNTVSQPRSWCDQRFKWTDNCGFVQHIWLNRIFVFLFV